jgi:hypothetical protein
VRKYATPLLVLLAALVLLTASVGFATIVRFPAGSPPVAVPGSDLLHNVATAKPGYQFANRGQSVDVVKSAPIKSWAPMFVRATRRTAEPVSWFSLLHI